MAASAEVGQFSALRSTNNDYKGVYRRVKPPRETVKFPFRQANSHRLSTKKPPEEVGRTLNPANIIPNNSELLELCSIGDLEAVLRRLELLKELNATVEEGTLIAIIRLCEHKRSREFGIRVWEIVLELCGCNPSLRVGNALLSMFVKCGDVGYAWNVFGRMTERNLFSWNILIGAYAKMGYSDEALSLYHRLLWIGFAPDVYTFPCVLRSCGASQDIVRGREVHCHVLRYEYHRNVDVSNALITMYGKCKEVEMAAKVFDQMSARDKISWNAMISCYVENEQCAEGVKMFQKMREHGAEPDAMTLTSIMSACELLQNAKLGREVHALILKTGHTREVSVCNSLIQFSIGAGRREDGEKIFSRMACRDVVTWTIMISSYENGANPEKALEAYGLMEVDGIQPDEITLSALLSCCASLGELRVGRKLHDAAQRTGLASHTMVANALIEMYSKCKCIDKALEIFHSIRSKNVISWTSMIVGLRINHRSCDALRLFQRMMRVAQPSSVTLISVLAACGRVGALTRGKEVHAQALKAGIADEGFLPNAILDFYVKCGKMALAENQFVSQVKDAGSWNTLLTGYAQRCQGRLAVDLFGKMLDSGVTPDDVTMVSLLRACSRSGMVKEGLEYFNTMRDKFSIIPNLKHHASVVDLLGRAKMLGDAHEFILKMEVRPDAAVWGALLNSCIIHRNVELGELSAEQILREDLENSGYGYYFLLCNFYACSGKWEELARVRRMMRENGFVSDPGCSWVEVRGKIHAFLSDDHFHPRIGDIVAVLEQFEEMVKEEEEEWSGGGDGEASKANVLCGHSERFAVGFSLISTPPGMPIWVTKNLYMCQSCHNMIRFISKTVRREITVRDANQFHYFKDGFCSCGKMANQCQ